MNTWRRRALAVVAVALAGCGEPQAIPPDGMTRITRTVYRMVDKEAGVVCYVSTQAMDCLPLGETRLDDGQ